MASTALGMSVGSLAASAESAVAIAPAVMVIFIVFGGLYVVNTPWYLRYGHSIWCIYIYLYTYMCLHVIKLIRLYYDYTILLMFYYT